MFSLGCLYYYVLSEGKHPFGEPLWRQTNILSGDFNLNEMKGDTSMVELARMLIRKLISSNGDKRPPAAVVCLYPLFWKENQILSFLQVY